jgi:hypothetical protein
MPKKVEAPAGAPQVTAGLPTGVYKYKASIKMGDRSLEMSMATTIQETGGVWTATDTVTMPMGEMSDTTTYDKKALTLVTRSIKQGPVTIDLAVKDNKLKGKIVMSGQEKPFETELAGPLFADGAGSPFAIGALPLTEGYSVTIRNFDVQKQKEKLMLVKVAGSESVTVPAGTFNAYRVEITPAEGGAESITVWIAKDSRKPVKTAAVLPQRGGATLTAELQ